METRIDYVPPVTPTISHHRADGSVEHYDETPENLAMVRDIIMFDREAYFLRSDFFAEPQDSISVQTYVGPNFDLRSMEERERDGGMVRYDDRAQTRAARRRRDKVARRLPQTPSAPRPAAAVREGGKA